MGCSFTQGRKLQPCGQHLWWLRGWSRGNAWTKDVWESLQRAIGCQWSLVGKEKCSNQALTPSKVAKNQSMLLHPQPVEMVKAREGPSRYLVFWVYTYLSNWQVSPCTLVCRWVWNTWRWLWVWAKWQEWADWCTHKQVQQWLGRWINLCTSSNPWCWPWLRLPVDSHNSTAIVTSLTWRSRNGKLNIPSGPITNSSRCKLFRAAFPSTLRKFSAILSRS